MASLDLDARRREYESESHEVTMASRVWLLPPKLPLMVAEHMARNNVGAAIELLFGPDSLDTLGPLVNQDDIEQILAQLYGLSPDESSAPVEVSARPAANGSSGRKQVAAKARPR